VPQLMPSTSSNMRGSVMRGMERRTVRMAASFIRLARDAADQPCNEVKQEPHCNTRMALALGAAALCSHFRD
jgi:hypothetical protein